MCVCVNGPRLISLGTLAVDLFNFSPIILIRPLDVKAIRCESKMRGTSGKGKLSDRKAIWKCTVNVTKYAKPVQNRFPNMKRKFRMIINVNSTYYESFRDIMCC